jgi:hypothetical protein
MEYFRRHLHRSAWLALTALLLAAVAPALAHVFSEPTRTDWVEVCTAQGAKWVPVAQTEGTDGERAPLSAHGSIDHCPYCTLQAVPALLQRDDAARLRVLAGASRKAPTTQAPIESLAWPRAQPRGPPRAR